MSNDNKRTVRLIGASKTHFIVKDAESGKVEELPRRIACHKSVIDSLPFQLGDDVQQSDGNRKSPWQRVHFFHEPPCFGLVVNSSSKSYFVQKDVGGRTVRLTIGRHMQPLRPDEARAYAREKLVDMQKGIDPIKEKRELRREHAKRGFTLQKLWDDFKAKRVLKPNTRHDYDRLIQRVLADWLSKPACEITSKMVEERHQKTKVNSGDAYADYAMKVLSSLMNYAIGSAEESGVTINPVLVLNRKKLWAPNVRRTNYVHDLAAWYRGIHQVRRERASSFTEMVCDYLELVISTGLRREEAASLKWDQVDFSRMVLRVTETKNGCEHVLPLTSYHLGILENRQRYAISIQSEWVFPSVGRKNLDTHLVEPRSVTEHVEKASGVRFTIHDLRRTFATIADSKDVSYYSLKRLLNHKMNGDVTAGYVQTSTDRLKDPMTKITDHLVAYKALAQDMKIVAS